MKHFRTFLLALFIGAVTFAFLPVQAAVLPIVQFTEAALLVVAGGSLAVWAVTHLLASLGGSAAIDLSVLKRFAAPQTGSPQVTAFA